MNEDRAGRAPVLLAALASFAMSALLLPRSPGMGDSAELTLALALAGIPHPTGYPLYTLAGHAFVVTAHGIGASWIVAANLWSALGAAVGAGASARVVQHVVAMLDQPGRAPASRPRAAHALAIALPLLLVLFNPIWIESATVAEVHSWNGAMIAIAAAFMLGRLGDLDRAAVGAGGVSPDLRASRSPGASSDVRTAVIWGLICGANATLHATSALFIIPFSAALVAAFVRAVRWRAVLALAALGAALLPLATYLWIPWRAAHPARFQWPVGPSARALWLHMTGAAYAQYVGRFAPTAEQWNTIRAGVLPWLLPGLLLMPVIALRLRRPSFRIGLLALIAAAVLQIVFIVRYGVPDPAMYFLPTLLPGLLIAVPLMAWITKRAAPAVALIPALLLVAALAAWSIPSALDRRAELDRVDAEFRSAWRGIPFTRGIVLWADDHYQRFKLLQVLEGERPGLYVENPDVLIWPSRRRAFIDSLGFDPLADVVLRTPADLKRIPESVRLHSTLPVLVLEEHREPDAARPTR